MNIKPIYQLPATLLEGQEWACEGGCDHVSPKLHRHVYQQVWDAEGTLLEQKAEHYYTCENGHLLCVWDNDHHDYVELPYPAYEEPVNQFGLSLYDIEQFLAELQQDTEQFKNDMNMPNAAVTASLTITTPKGETVNISISYLNEIRAQLTVCPIA